MTTESNQTSRTGQALAASAETRRRRAGSWSLRRGSRVLALGLLLITVGAWGIRGANTGWTKTSVPVTRVDEVTGIEGIEYHSRFVPGLDALAAGVLGALGIFGLSFLFHAPRLTQSPNTTSKANANANANATVP
jgi:hypothetical protein